MEAATNHRLARHTESAFVFFVALLPRLYVALAWAREPVWDGFYYHLGARQIASGFGYADSVNGAWHPWCHYPVGYSAFSSVFVLDSRRWIESCARRECRGRRRPRHVDPSPVIRRAWPSSRTRRRGARRLLTRAHRLLGVAHDRAARIARRARRRACDPAYAMPTRRSPGQAEFSPD